MGSKSLFAVTIPGNSILHKMDPRIKLVVAIILMATVLMAQQGIYLFLLFFFTAILILLSQISLKIVLKSVRPILLILLFAFIFHIFSENGRVLWQFGVFKIYEGGVIDGVKTTTRLVLLIINTSLFLTLTTKPTNIAEAMQYLLSPLAVLHFPVHEFALMMSIALRFVPTLLEEADKIMKAQSSRGANYDTGKFFTRVRGYVSILVPLFISCFRRAEELATAMEARCYNGEKHRTRKKAAKLQARDFAALTVALLLLISAIFGQIPLQKLLMGA